MIKRFIQKLPKPNQKLEPQNFAEINYVLTISLLTYYVLLDTSNSKYETDLGNTGVYQV